MVDDEEVLTGNGVGWEENTGTYGLRVDVKVWLVVLELPEARVSPRGSIRYEPCQHHAPIFQSTRPHLRRMCRYAPRDALVPGSAARASVLRNASKQPPSQCVM